MGPHSKVEPLAHGLPVQPKPAEADRLGSRRGDRRADTKCPGWASPASIRCTKRVPPVDGAPVGVRDCRLAPRRGHQWRHPLWIALSLSILVPMDQLHCTDLQPVDISGLARNHRPGDTAAAYATSQSLAGWPSPVASSLAGFAPVISSNHQASAGAAMGSSGELERRTEQSEVSTPLQQHLLTSQQQQVATARPGRLLAEYVSHQGQRILRNLVNTSIADLVSQSTTRIANTSKQLAAAGQLAAAAAGASAPAGSSPVFPSMGRLYTLLFPTMAPATTAALTSSSTTAASVTSTSSDASFAADNLNQMVSNSSSGEESGDSNELSWAPGADGSLLLAESPPTGSQMIKLSAPYDSQPRPSPVSQAGPSSWRLMGNGLGQAGDEGGGPAPLMGSLEPAPEHQQHQAQSSEASEQSGLLFGQPSMTVESTAMLGGAPEEPEGSPEPVHASLDTQSRPDEQTGHLSSHHQHQEPPDAAAKRPGGHQEEIYLSQQQSEPEFQAHHSSDFLTGEIAGFAEQRRSRGDQGASLSLFGEDQAGPNQTTGHGQLVDSLTLETGEPGSAPMDAPELEGQQQVLEKEDEVVQQQQQEELSGELIAGSDKLTIAGSRSRITNSTGGRAPEEAQSLFAVPHLPAQYESALRLPPEGYYDDYYKPSSSSQSSVSAMQPSQQQARGPSEYGHLFGGTYQRSVGNSSQKSGPSQRLHAGPSMEHRLEYVSDAQVNPSSNWTEAHHGNQQLLPRGSANYEIQHMYERQSPYQRSYTAADDPRHRQHLNGSSFRSQNRAPQVLGRGEDTIQLIIANSAGPDSHGHEKVINYVSEGPNNMSRIVAGKSPRNSFINKDMNEFPAEAPTTRATPLLLEGHLIRAGPNGGPPSPGTANIIQLQLRPPEDASDLGGRQKSMESHRVASRGRAEIETRPEPSEDHDELSTPPSSIQTSTGSSNRPVESGRSERPRRARRRDKSVRNNSNRQAQASKLVSNRSQQPVTQVHFNPQDLPMVAPTPAPSDVTLEQVADLPRKMRKMRQQQPDKNELMNELLSALDRVKLAIYRLQPLTAKMNAIYRKSVTSNSRNLVMDKHKGTYAKRYPPGHYDDSYDRIQVIEGQAGARRGSVSGRSDSSEAGEGGSSTPASSTAASVSQQQSAPQVGADVESGESIGVASYMNQAGQSVIPAGLFRRWGDSSVGGQLEDSADPMAGDESRIVATGLGRRLEDGRLAREKVTLTSSPEHFSLSSWPTSVSSHSGSTGNVTSPDKSPVESGSEAEEAADGGPVFGYRITIFQSPSEGSQGLSYRLDGLADGERPEQGSEQELEQASDGQDEEDQLESQDEAMLGSESSIVAEATPPSTTSSGNGTREAEESKLQSDLMQQASSAASSAASSSGSPDGSASPEGKEQWSGKRNSDEKGRKDGNKKSSMKRRKEELEGKRSKEYKKIKHNKGLVSKERKSMKRDKHVRAHDRGAAKEKALKERTQIEFFEREQIVDDEFEKAKKSSVKGAWQSGHDSRKALKSGSSLEPDTMSSGGSHYVKHEPKEEIDQMASSASQSHQGASLGAHSSSGKKSNKMEKRQMEAKGKKFKGWREKGYKIITETEFIDRGSLHDSAYKKHDKGSADHHKFKRQEASSEGQQGSLVEQRKRLDRKEETSRSNERREIKTGEEAKSERKQRQQAGNKHAEPMKASASKRRKRPVLDITPLYDRETNHEHDEASSDLDASNVLEPTRAPQQVTNKRQHNYPTGSHQRSSGGAGEELGPARRQDVSSGFELEQKRSNGTSESSSLRHQHQQTKFRNETSGSSSTMNERRLDIQANKQDPQMTGGSSLRSNTTSRNLIGQGNATILDIVDNLTGRKVNKSKIGTYDLEEVQHNNGGRVNASTSDKTNSNSNSNLSRYQPTMSKLTFTNSTEFQPVSDRSTDSTTIETTTSTTTTTTKPQNRGLPSLNLQTREAVDLLSSLLNRHHNQQHPKGQSQIPLNSYHSSRIQAMQSQPNHNYNSINDHRSNDNQANPQHGHLNQNQNHNYHNYQNHKPNQPLAHQGSPLQQGDHPAGHYGIHPEQAARLLQLVQRANVAQAAAGSLAEQQSVGLHMNMAHLTHPVGSMGSRMPIHRAAFLPQPSALAMPLNQAAANHAGALFGAPNFGPVNGLAHMFGQEQYLSDYEHEQAQLGLQSAHNFLTE